MPNDDEREAMVEAAERRIRPMLLRVTESGDALGIAVAAIEAAEEVRRQGQITEAEVEAAAKELHGASPDAWDWLARTHPSKAYEWRERARLVLEAARDAS